MHRDERYFWLKRTCMGILFLTVIVPSLYFAAWKATEKWGIKHPLIESVIVVQNGTVYKATEIHSVGQTCPMPFIICFYDDRARAHYSVWLFGLSFDLPFRSR